MQYTGTTMGARARVLASAPSRLFFGKATLFASRKGEDRQIEVNVVRGVEYEAILSKQTMLDMNLIQS